MHNLQIHDHKKLDILRSILQKIGIDLDDFSILYDFMKLGKNLELKHEHSIKNGREKVKIARQFEKFLRTDSNPVQFQITRVPPKRHRFGLTLSLANDFQNFVAKSRSS